MKNILEIMEKVIRESNAQKFIDQEASHLSDVAKKKLARVLTRYEKFLQTEEELIAKEYRDDDE
jgi:hypothetical protein